MSADKWKQYSLFPPARARATDPDTSQQAAEFQNEDPARLTALRLKVYEWFESHDGIGTDDELERDQRFHGLAPSSARKRRGELVEMGWLRDSGERQINSRGRNMIVWELVRKPSAA